ncbi:MAG TPA: gliding motility-associated C-terminal domain-containing protein, partial [Chitinophagaceae bacterium]|nr:gliding motility-associated C-terminal domain-containing protein [Chitinophagaceae bacterium]
NGSFELYNHCPVVYTYDSDYNAAMFWQYGSHTSEADYYHNLTCSFDSTQLMLHMPPAFPLPDGSAFISILNGAYIDPIPENQMAKGYVGQCLQAPLKQGEQYTLSFYAGRFRSWDNYTGKIFPFTVAIFGNADCNAVPFGKPNVFGNGCPSNYPGWVLLGKTDVTSAGSWVQSKITFTAPSDINVIEIGPDCSILPPIIDLTDSTTFLDYHIYYLDDLHLLPTKDFPFEYIHVQTGSACQGSGIPLLEAPVFANATYQWYKDSIAISGATATTYQPPDTSRAYFNAVITTPGKCVTTEPFLILANGLRQLHIPADTTLCANGTLLLAQPIDGITYYLSGVASSEIMIRNQGSYSITATDNYGCQRIFATNVVEQKCEDCAPSLPNAFTPNGDGHNDIFRPKLFCNISEFDLQVFDRWGEKVFESHNAANGWDGTFSGSKMVTGVYVYLLQYKTASHLSKSTTGTVVLIR